MFVQLEELQQELKEFLTKKKLHFLFWNAQDNILTVCFFWKDVTLSQKIIKALTRIVRHYSKMRFEIALSNGRITINFIQAF